MANKNKWTRDTNGDRYCAWHLAPVGAEDAAAEAVASVFPDYSITARVGGKPSHYTVFIGCTKINKTYPSIRAATKAAETMLVLPLPVGTKIVQLSTGERGAIVDLCPTEFAEPMYSVQIGHYFGQLKPSEIAVAS